MRKMRTICCILSLIELNASQVENHANHKQIAHLSHMATCNEPASAFWAQRISTFNSLMELCCDVATLLSWAYSHYFIFWKFNWFVFELIKSDLCFCCAHRFDARKLILSNQTFQVFSEVESVVEQLPLIENKEGGRRAINRKWWITLITPLLLPL